MSESNHTPGLGIPRSELPQISVEQLLSDLREFEDKTRLEALRELAHRGDSQAVPALLGRLTNEKLTEGRILAAKALYRIGNSQAWPTFASCLANDQEPSVRSKLAELLGLLGEKEYAPALVSALRDPVSEVRQNVATALGQIKSETVINNLINGLANGTRDKSPDYEDDYIKALGAMGPMVVEVLMDLVEIQKLMPDASYLDKEGGYIQRDNKFILPEPVGYYSGRDYSSRKQVYLSNYYAGRIEVLAQIGTPAVPIITKYVQPSADIAKRIIGTRALGAIKSESAATLLCQIAKQDSSPAIRWLAVSGLHDRPANQVESTLLSVLRKDEEWCVRYMAASGLGTIKDLSEIDPLCQAALTDKQAEVRQAAILSLDQKRDVRAISTWGTIVLNDPSPEARLLAIEAMQKIGSVESGKHLVQFWVVTLIPVSGKQQQLLWGS